MRSVLIALFDDVQSLDVTGPLEVFTGEGDRQAYQVRTASLGGTTVRTSSGLRITPDGDLSDHSQSKLDLLLVPGGVGATRRPPELVTWIRNHAGNANRVASVCTGAYLLAEAGLLDGRRATTHWARCADFQASYPAVRVEPDPIFVKDGRIATSAGVTAGIDLALALVEDDLGRDQALAVARHLVVFLRRPGSQSQFSTQLAAQVAQRQPLREVQQWIAEHPAADLSVENLAVRARLSPRHFARAFTAEVGLTPGRYVERTRLEAARRHLEDTAEGIEQTARTCGYRTPEAMRRAFIAALGVGPAEYRRRFRPGPSRRRPSCSYLPGERPPYPPHDRHRPLREIHTLRCDGTASGPAPSTATAHKNWPSANSRSLAFSAPRVRAGWRCTRAVLPSAIPAAARNCCARQSPASAGPGHCCGAPAGGPIAAGCSVRRSTLPTGSALRPWPPGPRPSCALPAGLLPRPRRDATRHQVITEDRENQTVSPEFETKRVLITGGTAGIGKAAAAAFAAAGARVIIVGRDADRGAAVVDDIKQHDGRAEFLAFDLSRANVVGELVDATGPVDVLVTSAGYRPAPGPAVSTSADDLSLTLLTNVTVPYLLSAAYGSLMTDHGGGAMVHVSSGNGTLDQEGFAAYNVSKAAVNAVVRAFAHELGRHGVRVNAVAPGPTYTPYTEQFGAALDQLMAPTPLGRPGTADQVAAAILFLASQRASHITGAVLPVDGGQTIVI